MNPSRMHPYALLAGTFLATLILGCTQGPSAPKAAATPAAPAAAPTSPSAPAPAAPAAVGDYAFYAPASEADLQKNTHYGYVIAKTGPGFDTRTFTAQGFTVTGQFKIGTSSYYHLHRDGALLPSLDGLSKTRGVLFAHPDLKLTAFGSGITYGNPDPLTQAEEYSVYLTHAMDAWTTYGFGPNSPIIADIDTGVNWSHEDFQKGGVPTIIHAYSWWDLTNNTYSESSLQDYAGSPTITNTDEDSHGSHTMGTIGAQGDNGLGVAGVCWNAQLVSYKCFNDYDGANSGSEWAIYGSLLDLINWKQANNYTGTIPVNMSLGGGYAEPFDLDVLQYGIQNNVVVIAAMGNEGQSVASYPAAYAGVIAVGATNGQDQVVAFSSKGSHISVCAPGLNVISTGNWATDAYFIDSGTSMATPFVTGLVGYMLTFQPNLTPAQIKTELETYADMIEGNTGFNIASGHGRVNVLNTIKNVATGTLPAPKYSDNLLNVFLQGNLTDPATVVSYSPVYLYRTDATGKVLAYAACAITDDFGEASFSLLSGTNYVATAVLGGQAFSTPVIAVAADDTKPIADQTINIPVTYGQVLPDAGASQLPYGTLTLYDGDTGDFITQMYAYYVPFELPMVLTSGKTYLLGMTPYLDGSIGEYALYVSPSNYPTYPAPGSFAAPATNAGSASQSPYSPQTIQLDTLYNGNLTLAGDWYQLVEP